MFWQYLEYSLVQHSAWKVTHCKAKTDLTKFHLTNFQFLRTYENNYQNAFQCLHSGHNLHHRWCHSHRQIRCLMEFNLLHILLQNHSFWLYQNYSLFFMRLINKKIKCKVKTMVTLFLPLARHSNVISNTVKILDLSKLLACLIQLINQKIECKVKTMSTLFWPLARHSNVISNTVEMSNTRNLVYSFLDVILLLHLKICFFVSKFLLQFTI